jgi:hypothetical protein
MNSEKKYLLSCIVGLAIGVMVTKSYYDKRTNVAEVITRDRVVTRIIEGKDGSKETVIVSDSTKSEKTVTAKITNWAVGVGTSLTELAPVHSLFIDRRILGEFSVGVYGRSDKEAGVILKYTF